MLKKENYLQLKAKYGHLASWAVWTIPDEAVDKKSSKVDDMSSFANEDHLLTLIHNRFVFFALNGSIAHHNGQDFNNWKNFHSSYKFQKDYKLRAALYQTPFWGSYITDVIKNHPTVGRNELLRDIRKSPEILEQNKKMVLDELRLLEGNPTLIAIGGDAFQLLKNMFPDRENIMQIPHYAIYCSCDDYVALVYQSLKI
jgi:hypothetical protein